MDWKINGGAEGAQEVNTGTARREAAEVGVVRGVNEPSSVEQEH